MNTRLMASRIINAVTDGASLADVLPHSLEQIKDVRDRALVQAICYGVCRYYTSLDIILSHLLSKPMREQDADVHALLLVGLYQLIDMRIPEHAAVSETVNATQKLKKPWSRGFVNAILREYLRSKARLADIMDADEEAFYAHPMWWIEKIKKAWPDQWQQILEANNEHPPFSLRVNLSHLSRDKYIQALGEWASARSEESASTATIAETQSGVILSTPVQVEDLPGFANGDISVQDGAAQLAAELLNLEKGQRVLDACSAPGGKLIHMIECEPNLAAIVAVEKDAERMQMIEENIKRSGIAESVVTSICGDVSKPTWWDGQLFDRILIDAPCSASGVIRRHPDIKLLRQPTDLKNLVNEQKKILRSLWETLKPGGILVYATCSVFPEENVGIVNSFIDAQPDAEEDKIIADWGLSCDVGRQILPDMHNMDGFYYARLKKKI